MRADWTCTLLAKYIVTPALACLSWGFVTVLNPGVTVKPRDLHLACLWVRCALQEGAGKTIEPVPFRL